MLGSASQMGKAETESVNSSGYERNDSVNRLAHFENLKTQVVRFRR